MIEEIEKLRKEIVKRKKIVYAIYALILVLLIIVFKSRFPFFIVFLLVLAIITDVIVNGKKTKEFKDLYKKNIVVETFKTMFGDIYFDLNNGISRYVLKDTGMMYLGDRYSSNDYVKGKYKNINFECSDVHIQREDTDSDGNTTYVTIFLGQWFIFDFNKTFKSNILVSEKSFYCSRHSGLKKVELEDMDFNKKFNVHAKEEIDAFYVLTPNTMQKIKDITSKLKGHIAYFFVDNKLHIGLDSGKDLFEPKLFKPVNFEEASAKTREEIKSITDFIDLLNLDNDLFKKEV